MSVGIARACPPFLLGFDCLTPVNEEIATQAAARGLRWVGQYLEVLTPATRDLIWAHDLGIAPLTEAETSRPLSVQTGADRGALAVAQCEGLEMAPTVHVTIDLELPYGGSDCPGHVNAFSDRLLKAYFAAALYVGVPEPLNAPQLFALRPNRYWKGGGQVPEPHCGWSALQLEPLEGLVLAGTRVDVNVSKLDYFGRAMTMWWRV
jgi:hypothetical protein